jgi:Rps23 Pro-64 3,4-dihydroxylase Tpa1-like proline 4-hydroxylase
MAASWRPRGGWNSAESNQGRCGLIQSNLGTRSHSVVVVFFAAVSRFHCGGWLRC